MKKPSETTERKDKDTKKPKYMAKRESGRGPSPA